MSSFKYFNLSIFLTKKDYINNRTRREGLQKNIREGQEPIPLKNKT